MTIDGQLCYETIRMAKERGVDPARFVGLRVKDSVSEVPLTPDAKPAREPMRECTGEPRIKMPGLAERAWKTQVAAAG